MSIAEIEESMSWANEYLALSKVYDFSQDPEDFRFGRQSMVTINGILSPLDKKDSQCLDGLFDAYEVAFDLYQSGRDEEVKALPYLTAKIREMIKNAVARAKEPIIDLEYVNIDPRDYTFLSVPKIEVPLIKIHTRPERCRFLAVMKLPGKALGESLGRMRVKPVTELGVYPFTLRTKWRALTNPLELKEARDAYRRLIQKGG